jgi:hypothetical protein
LRSSCGLGGRSRANSWIASPDIRRTSVTDRDLK